MEIRQLRYFLDIAQTEHLTQSAQNLFVTQSTLSHGLRRLEEELDPALFAGLGRGLKLSQGGAEFRAYATRALKEIEAVSSSSSSCLKPCDSVDWVTNRFCADCVRCS